MNITSSCKTTSHFGFRNGKLDYSSRIKLGAVSDLGID